MKSELPMGAVIGAVVAVLAIAGAIIYFATRTPEPTKAGAVPGPAMPPDVQAEFNKRMGSGTPTGPGAGGPGPGPGPGPGGPPAMTGPGGMLPTGPGGMGGK